MAESKTAELNQLTAIASETDSGLGMDEQAFHLFYQRTARPLWAYLSRVSGHRQRADDLLQESFYRFLKCGRQFESEAHQRHYLFRIATNLVLDDRKRGRVEFESLSDAARRDVPREAHPDASGLSSALATLSARERSLLWLAYAEGSSHDEIAAQTGLTSGSVKQLLYRARRRLASILGGRR